jgi:hypothetical protein
MLYEIIEPSLKQSSRLSALYAIVSLKTDHIQQ